MGSDTICLYDLKTNFQDTPLLNEREDIFFSWKLKSSLPHIMQKQYRIKVLKKESFGFSCVWDSGYKTSGNSINVKYEGGTLPAETIYCWELYVLASNEKMYKQTSGYFYTSCDWEDSQWITSKENYQTVIFSASCQLSQDKAVSSAILYTSALGIYNILINRSNIGTLKNGNQIMLTPGWSDYLKRIQYQCYDITEQIHQKSLMINAFVGNGWFSGKIGRHSLYENLFKDKLKQKCFIAKLIIIYEDGSRQTIQTNTDHWKCRKDPQILENDLYDGEYVSYLDKGFQEEEEVLLPNFAQKQSVVTSRLYPGNEAFVIADFQNAREPVSGFYYQPSAIIHKTADKPCGQLNRKITSLRRNFILDAAEELILDFGQNSASVFELDVETLDNAVSTVHIETAEMLNDGKSNPSVPEGGSDGPEFSLYRKNLSLPAGGECLSREILVLEGTSHRLYHPTFTYHGFRYIKISTDHTLKIRRITQIPLSSAVKQTGYLKTNNPDVNQLIQNTFWSQRSNYMTIPTDCPQRSERVGWTADAQIFAATALYNFDVTAFLTNYADIINNSSTCSQYTAIMPQAFLPDFSGIYAAGFSDIGIILIWQLYKHTGNTAVIEKYYKNMAQYMKEIGCLNDINTKYDRALFGDWLAFQPTSTEFLNLMYRAYCALLMSEMAEAIGQAKDALEYKYLYSCIKDHVQNQYVLDHPDGFVLMTSPRDGSKTSMHGYTFADNAQTGLLWFLKLKLYRSEKQREHAIRMLTENIRNEAGCCRTGYTINSLAVGFLGINVLLPVLSEAASSDTAYDLLLNEEMPSWLYSVKNGATTIWERWNSYSLKDSFADAKMNSFNHYSFGAVVEWIYRYMAGIRTITVNGEVQELELFPIIDRGTKYNAQQRINRLECLYESLVGTIKIKWEAAEKKLKKVCISIPANTISTLYLDTNGEDSIVSEACEGADFKGITKKCGLSAAVYRLTPGSYTCLITKSSIHVEKCTNHSDLEDYCPFS